jgi:hypothetical protein
MKAAKHRPPLAPDVLPGLVADLEALTRNIVIAVGLRAARAAEAPRHPTDEELEREAVLLDGVSDALEAHGGVGPADVFALLDTLDFRRLADLLRQCKRGGGAP